MTSFLKQSKLSWALVLALILSLGISQASFLFPQVALAEEATSTPAGAYLSGWKYYDVNYNRTRDGVWPDDEAGEPGVPSWIIHLYKPGEYTPFLTTTAEGDKGIFEFSSVPAGDYLLCEDFGWDDVWYQTDPYEGGGSSWMVQNGDLVNCPNTTWGYQVSGLADGEERYGFDFGNSKWASVRVNQVAFPNTGDFEFKLEGTDNDYEEELTTTGSTATSSPLSFLKLLPGHYTLSQTVSATSSQSIVCTDGATTTDPTNLNLVSGTQIDCTYQNGVDFGGEGDGGSEATSTPTSGESTGSTSGGNSGNDNGSTKRLTNNNDNNSNGTGGTETGATTGTGGVGLLNPLAPLALNDIGLTADEDVIGAGEEEFALATTIGIGTATSSITASSSLLAAIGNLGWGTWWFWLLILLIILAIGGGYWYWRRRQENY